MLPEISRRCLACGASVRAGARFCPQCGYNLGDEEGPAGQSAAAEESPPPARNDGGDGAAAGEEHIGLRTTRETPVAPEAAAPRHPPATRETSATRDMAAPRETQAAPLKTQAAMGGTQAEPAVEGGRAADGTGAEALGRSRRAAARVKETVMPRVEKMRDEALVVIEETPDDSGLRFVIIAVFLFGLFLLFLLLSTTVLR